MHRAFRVFAITVVTIGSLVGMAGTPAQADSPPTLCEQAWFGGEWLLPYSVGRCINWGGATLCHEQYANADPEIKTEFYVCAPMPVAAP